MDTLFQYDGSDSELQDANNLLAGTAPDNNNGLIGQQLSLNLSSIHPNYGQQ